MRHSVQGAPISGLQLHGEAQPVLDGIAEIPVTAIQHRYFGGRTSKYAGEGRVRREGEDSMTQGEDRR